KAFGTRVALHDAVVQLLTHQVRICTDGLENELSESGDDPGWWIKTPGFGHEPLRSVELEHLQTVGRSRLVDDCVFGNDSELGIWRYRRVAVEHRQRKICLVLLPDLEHVKTP